MSGRKTGKTGNTARYSFRTFKLSGVTAFLVAGVFFISAVGFIARGVSLIKGADAGVPVAAAAVDAPVGGEGDGLAEGATTREPGEAAVDEGRTLLFTLSPDSSQTVVSASIEQVEQIEEDEHDPDKAAGEHIKIEIAGIKSEPPVKKDKPAVLIYHTHTYEAFRQDGDSVYALASGAMWRTQDSSHNIIKVGEELAELLRDKGFTVVHDMTEFEPPKLGTAYIRSLEMLKNRQKSGEQYDLIIDMHRDAYTQKSWSPQNVVINGKPCARLMFLIGTGEDGFTEKPNWKANYALADSLVKKLQAINGDLCKDVNVKTQRYNQHVSENCVLIEVGHNENTLAEAVESMRYLADAIEKTLSK